MDAFTNDTLVCDTTALNGLSSNSSYDYNSELNAENESLLRKLLNSISEWFSSSSNNTPNIDDNISLNSNLGSVLGYVLIAVIVIALLLLLFYMYKKKMFFFKSNAENGDDALVVEDSIYGVDFEHDIDLALKSSNYKEAIRLRYLQCLRLLSDNSLIDWRIYKTPTQYTQEFKNDVFSQFTRQYVFIRYSGYKATEADYREMCDQKKVIEDKADEIKSASTKQEEGGNDED